MSSKRSGSIDFLRFLLAVVIVFFHGRKLAGTGLFPRGATAVEAFFVISGYYMAREAFTKKTDALTYMKKRYVGLFPYHAFAFICAFVFRCYKNGWLSHLSLRYARKILILSIRSVPEFLLLHPIAGLKYMLADINGLEWYLSALLLGMALLYPLLKKWPKQFCYYAAPLIFLFVSGRLAQKVGSFRVTYAMIGLINGGLLRSVSMLSLGIFTYGVTQYLNEKTSEKAKGGVWLPLLAIGFWLVAFTYFNSTWPKKYEFAIVYFIAGGMALLAMDLKIPARIFNHKCVYFLGKLSFPMFLNQGWIRKVLMRMKLKNLCSYTQCMLIFFGCTIIVSLICIFVMDHLTAWISARSVRTPESKKC